MVNELIVDANLPGGITAQAQNEKAGAGCDRINAEMFGGGLAGVRRGGKSNVATMLIGRPIVVGACGALAESGVGR